MSLETIRKPLPGYYRIYFPTVDVPSKNIDFIKLEVQQRLREHDVAVIRMKSRRVNWFKYFSSGTPVRIAYWSSLDSKVKKWFIGYVTHVRLVSSPPEDNTLPYERDIVCVDASRVLRQAAQKTYRNKTPADIVTEIGKQFGFNVIATQSGLRRETITQSGQTYWQFLHRLADKVGYVLKVEGMNLIFMPLTEYARNYIDASPMITDFFFPDAADNEIPNLFHIDSWSGDTSLDAKQLSDEAVFASVNPVTDAVNFSTARPTDRSRSNFQRFLSSDAASHNKYDANLLARGAADNGLLAIESSMRVLGNPEYSPYRPVTLNLRDPNLTGTWLIKEARHRITSGLNPEYDCDVTLGTDSVDGISRRRLVRGPSSTRQITRQLLGTDNTPSRLITSQNGFVLGSSSSSTSTWAAR